MRQKKWENGETISSGFIQDVYLLSSPSPSALLHIFIVLLTPFLAIITRSMPI